MLWMRRLLSPAPPLLPFAPCALLLRLAPLLLVLLVSPAPVAGAAELWQWTDEDGTVRYTPSRARIPSGRGGTAIRLEPGMSAPPGAPAPLPAAGVYAPRDEVAFDADPFNAPSQAQSLEAEQLLPAPPPAVLPEPPPTPNAAPPPVEAAAAPIEAAAAPVEAAAPPPADAAPAPSELSPEEARARRAELEAQIAADEQRLKELISNDAQDDLQSSPELHEIARRLPRLQEELRRLESTGEAGP